MKPQLPKCAYCGDTFVRKFSYIAYCCEACQVAGQEAKKLKLEKFDFGTPMEMRLVYAIWFNGEKYFRGYTPKTSQIGIGTFKQALLMSKICALKEAENLCRFENCTVLGTQDGSVYHFPKTYPTTFNLNPCKI